MNTSDLYTFIQYKHPFSEEDTEKLEALVRKYPWFSIGQQLLLKAYKEIDQKKFNHLLPKVAILTSDRRKLFFFLRKIAEAKDLSVEFDIEGTIETLPGKKNREVNDNLLLNFSNEYFSLENLESSDSKNSPENELITKFIQVNPKIIPASQIADALNRSSVIVESPEEEEPASEALAEIFISQGLYSKAESCYRKLSLLNPEKSIYFANLISNIKNK